jgi:hypothetical protein
MVDQKSGFGMLGRLPAEIRLLIWDELGFPTKLATVAVGIKSEKPSDQTKMIRMTGHLRCLNLNTRLQTYAPDAQPVDTCTDLLVTSRAIKEEVYSACYKTCLLSVSYRNETSSPR